MLNPLIISLLLLLSLLTNSQADMTKIELPLREFAQKVATDNKVNILIQEAVDDETVTFFVGDKDATIFFQRLKKCFILRAWI